MQNIWSIICDLINNELKRELNNELKRELHNELKRELNNELKRELKRVLICLRENSKSH